MDIKKNTMSKKAKIFFFSNLIQAILFAILVGVVSSYYLSKMALIVIVAMSAFYAYIIVKFIIEVYKDVRKQ
jgi:hypothetical protein